MITPVNRLVLQSILFMITAASHAQELSEIGFKYTTSPTGYGLALTELLRKDVPISNKEICVCSFGFFYFRVTSKNTVDSIYYDGILGPEQKNKIVSNIKKTESHWVLKTNIDPAKKYWIVYPYFDFGRVANVKKNCTEAEQRMQKQILLLANNLGTTQYYIKREGAMLIRPGMAGNQFITDALER